MKISYTTHAPFQVTNQEITVVGTNSPHVYTELIGGLQGQNENIDIVDDQYKQIEIEKGIDWIGDIGNGGLVVQKYLTKVEKVFIESLTDKKRNQIHDQMNEMFNLISEQLFMLDLPISVNYDFDLKRTFKYCGVHFDPLMLNNPYGIIESILKIHEECAMHSTIALTNVAHYLTPVQFLELKTLVRQTDQSIILIEFTEMGSQEFYGNSDFYYIDADFVDWHL